MATSSGRSGESLGKAVVHPFLSRGFDDQLSVLLIRSAPSLVWNIVALGALLSFVVVFLPQRLLDVPADSVIEKLLIGYAVIGVLWNALAALAHSSSSGAYGRGLLLFLFWPLAFAYNWRAVVRDHRGRDSLDDSGLDRSGEEAER